MKITDITAQKRRADRYSIYVDGIYAVALGEAELLDSRLRIGDEVTTEQLEQLEHRSLNGKALDRAYGFLSYRPRSVHEIRTYLRRKDYDDPTIEFVITRLNEYQLLDDAKFAADWIESRQLLAPRSKQKLTAELREKGVATDIIEIALANAGIDNEVATILRIITEKRLLQRYPEEQKLLQHLAGKGFSYHTSKAALEHLQNSLDEEA